jgi:hypothetical protein
MKWKGPEGTNGAPEGNQNQSAQRPWKAAIERALSKKGSCDKAEQLYLIAEQVVKAAQDKEDPNFAMAVKEVGLRLDGKPTEHIALTDDTAQKLVGISAAFASLVGAATGGTIIDGEIIMPSRSLLPVEVRTETGGHGEGLDLREMSGSPGES